MVILKEPLPIKDTNSVLLCNNPETYTFIEKMIKASSAPYRSNRIHIGMDEAWDLGRGEFLNKNGYQPSFDIICSHLDKVLKIIESQKLKPMMWSDMFFRVLSKKHDYYDTSVNVTSDIINLIPKNIELVYWDYYHDKTKHYDGMIDIHRKLNDKLIFAAGIHSWNRFWPLYKESKRFLEAGFKSCFANNVDESIITIWGDDGTDCDFFGTLPIIQYAADLVFTGECSMEKLF